MTLDDALPNWGETIRTLVERLGLGNRFQPILISAMSIWANTRQLLLRYDFWPFHRRRIVVRKRAIVALLILGAAFAVGNSFVNAGPRRLECGIDRSNLTWEPDAVVTKTLSNIAVLKVQWFRDELSLAGPGSYSRFVEEVKLAKARRLNFLAIVNSKSEDFEPVYKAPNPGSTFAKRCGWPSGSDELSKIDLSRFQTRLRAELDAVEPAGLTIDAFEIGNEYDWICFNGDVPDGHEASPVEFNRLVSGYGHFLDAAATVINDAPYFPEAEIITLGMTHVTDSFDVNNHITHSELILEVLRNLEGVNYLHNSRCSISGVGLHLFLPDDAKPGSALAVIFKNSHTSGGLPVWSTERSYNRNAFKARADITRPDAIDRFYKMLEDCTFPIGPNFFYAYSEPINSGLSLVEQDGRELPEAKEIPQRAVR